MSVLVARGIRKSYAGREVVAGLDIGLARLKKTAEGRNR